MRVVRMGCTINQMGPRMVCLYTVMTSRLTNMRSRSRYCQISLKLMSKAWRLGRMMRSKLSTNLSTNYTNLHELFIALIDPLITRIYTNYLLHELIHELHELARIYPRITRNNTNWFIARIVG